MHGTASNKNIFHEGIVLIRALEGIPLLMFALACLAFSLYVRHDPLL